MSITTRRTNNNKEILLVSMFSVCEVTQQGIAYHHRCRSHVKILSSRGREESDSCLHLELLFYS